MTAEDLVELLLSGRDGVFQWEDIRCEVELPDLSGVDLSHIDLSGANLSGMVLEEARLQGANLMHADLRGARLRGADLSGANLHEAYLDGCDLTGAELSRANLSGAVLVGAVLTDTNLSGANLSSAELENARFERTLLTGADVAWVCLGGTVLVDTDLQALCCANELSHAGPSWVDVQSLVRSVRAPKLKEFLLAAGMPSALLETLLGYAQKLSPGAIDGLLRSVFISYGGPDHAFAKRLKAALVARGVRTFFFLDDARWGDRLSKVMHDGIRSHDRVVLICSEASLQRPGVLNEIQETLDRETAEGGGSVLIPICLDDYVFEAWRPQNSHLADAVRSRVIGKFSQADDFESGLSKLIDALAV